MTTATTFSRQNTVGILLSIEKISFSLSSSSYNLKLSTKSFLKNDFNLEKGLGKNILA